MGQAGGAKLRVANAARVPDIVRVPAIWTFLSVAWRRGRRWVLAMAMIGSGIAWAAETAPVVGLGATREAVLDAYGWPNGQSNSGDREIFTYPQGQVILRNGVVERMEFSPNVAWPKPRPRPGAVTTTKEKAALPPPVVEDFWLASFAEASREARARPAHILALFTGSDWSPPCKRFLAEVAIAPAFVNPVGAEFVLLRLDLPTHTPLPADLRAQNMVLRERYHVTTYPTLLLLSAEGIEIGRVDLAKPRPQPSYVEQVIAAIAEAKPKPKALVLWKEERATSTPKEEAVDLKSTDWWLRQLEKYQWPIVGGVVALLLLWLWSRRTREPAPESAAEVAKSIMPTPADITTWTQERVRDVMAALFEYEGSRVVVRPTESGAELALMHPTEPRARVLVRCQSAAGGLAGGKSVRNLFATVVAERVDLAWYVSPGGFTPEARQFAREHGIVLIGGEDLLVRLKNVPPLALIRMTTAKTE